MFLANNIEKQSPSIEAFENINTKIFKTRFNVWHRINSLEKHLKAYKVENKLQNDLIKSLGNNEALFLAYTFGNKFNEEKSYSCFLFEPIDKTNFDYSCVSREILKFKEKLTEFDSYLKKLLKPHKVNKKMSTGESYDIEMESFLYRDFYNFLKLLIKICSSSGAYSNLKLVIVINQKIFKIFIPPINVIVDQKLGECLILITWSESCFEFCELNIESDISFVLQQLQLCPLDNCLERKNKNSDNDAKITHNLYCKIRNSSLKRLKNKHLERELALIFTFHLDNTLKF